MMLSLATHLLKEFRHFIIYATTLKYYLLDQSIQTKIIDDVAARVRRASYIPKACVGSK